MLRYVWTMNGRRSPEAFGRAMGALALGADTVDETARREVIASRLPSHEWPDRPMVITAVNARTGSFRRFDRTSGVALLDAVAASCAVPGVWPPVTIDGEKWIDGGMRSAVNADLAAGADRVVILAPLTAGIGAMPSVASQVKALQATGSRVVVISPDKAAKAAMGRNSLDPAKRAVSAEAGLRQAADENERVAELCR